MCPALSMPLATLLAVVLLGVACAASGQDLESTCHASSSYDLTLQPAGLIFDRDAPAPRRVALSQGRLTTDGASVSLRAEDQDRMALFERQLRALVPRVKQVAKNGVDLAVQTLREEGGELQLSSATRTQLDQRIAVQANQLKQRIDASRSTHDWQGDAAQAYGNQIMSDLMPLVAGDLGQQALTAAMSGDIDTATRLRNQATDLATTLRPRLERRMQSLRPQVQALCPAIERLAELQQGVRAAGGQPLDLLQVSSR